MCTTFLPNPFLLPCIRKWKNALYLELNNLFKFMVLFLISFVTLKNFFEREISELGLLAHSFHLSTWEVGSGQSLWVQGQQELASEFKASLYCIVRPCVKKQINNQNHKKQNMKMNLYVYDEIKVKKYERNIYFSNACCF